MELHFENPLFPPTLVWPKTSRCRGQKTNKGTFPGGDRGQTDEKFVGHSIQKTKTPDKADRKRKQQETPELLSQQTNR